VRNLIGTSALQATLRDVVGEMKQMKVWVSTELDTQKSSFELLLDARTKEINRRVDNMKTEVFVS